MPPLPKPRPCYSSRHVTLYHGDCREVLFRLDANYVDAVVTDPPYELGFMGKQWDKQSAAFDPVTWQAVSRVCKPGAHLLAFGGTRTFHRLACSIEDAGWEIRDCIMWVYGNGFPKNHDIGKAIDKEAGQQRPRVFTGRSSVTGVTYAQDAWTRHQNGSVVSSQPLTPAGAMWQGWGTALKPAWEPIIVARKPLIGTVAANVQQWATGAINVNGCRVPRQQKEPGRWPANLIHDGSQEVLELFPISKDSAWNGHRNRPKTKNSYGTFALSNEQPTGYGGSAARFFYCAKASTAERGSGNTHPTVKPLQLVRYLVRLVARRGAVVLDPFVGSGSTLLAAQQQGRCAIGIELERATCTIAVTRLTDRLS